MQFSNQMSNRSDRCGSAVLSHQQQLNDQQQLMMLFDEYRNNNNNNVLSDNRHNQFETLADIYNDESANIYTEPTVIDHNGTEISANEVVTNEIVNGFLSAPPLPPPPPPPIFTVPVMTPVTATSSSLALADPMTRPMVPNNNNQIHSLNTQDQKIDNSMIRDDLADIITIQSSNNTDLHRTQSRLTITGQDLAITLNNNGEITQTVLSNNSSDPNQLQSTNPQLLYYYYSQRVEFLPLCDLLFNIISLAAYFCNVVFDSVTAYTLYLNGQHLFLMISLMFILASASISQILSYTWYVKNLRFRQNYLQFQAEQQQQQLNQRNGPHQQNEQPHPATNPFQNSSPYELQSPISLALTHILFGGVLWRYFKLFAPVNLATVKREVRDLCVLRMIHAFSEAGPMLLLQMYLVWRNPSPKLITDLNIISIFLSLFSLCWALASFSKNIRQSKIHKLVLTWLGVIFQFFWRIGTIASRIVALTIYATVYGPWLFAVLFLHWFSMLLWILSPAISINNVSNDDANFASVDKKSGLKKRVCHGAMLAWVYIFCFINMEDSNSRQKMAAFYVTMFLENVLLSISLFFDNRPVLWYRSFAFFFVIGSFCFGMFFMWLYYKFFHIRHLKHSLGADVDAGHNPPRSNYQFCQNVQNQNNTESESFCNHLSQQQTNVETQSILNSKISPVARIVNAFSNQCFSNNISLYNGNQVTSTKHHHHFHNDNIPGVFNCRLNPALKRKKKKPSTVPPPPQSQSILFQNNQINSKQINDIRRTPLETITENMLPNQDCNQKSQFSELPANFRTNQNRRNLINQVQRPSTNTTLLTRQYRQPSADTFWRKSNLSARSLSISPSVMLKSENTFRLPAKHPFSSTITTPTSPLNFAPTENFTDKLELESNNKINENLINKSSNKSIIRPKPIMQYSLNLDGATDEMTQQQSQLEFADHQKYYYPYYHNTKLDSESPEVLLVSCADNGNAFYDSVIPDYSNQFFDYSKSNSTNNNNKNVEDENEFMRQFQRPPVPGREGGGDDMRTEDDNDNSSYVEGKRSIVNYGLDRGRLEKILEMKREEQVELDSHKSQYSQTLPKAELNKANKLKPKQNNRNLTSVKNKKKQLSKKIKTKTKRRTKLRPNSMHSVGSMDSSRSSFSSPDLAPSLTTSGDDGDIESDINQHERTKVFKPSYTFRRQTEGTNTMPVTSNYSHNTANNQDEYDEAFGSGEGNDDPANASANHPIKGLSDNIEHDPKSLQATKYSTRQIGSIRGLALDQFSADYANRISSVGSGGPQKQQQISNYHQRSSLRGLNNDRGTLFSVPASQQQNQKFLYHSAKYKRHNTPL